MLMATASIKKMEEKLKVHLECGTASCVSKSFACDNIYDDLDISRSK